MTRRPRARPASTGKAGDRRPLRLSVTDRGKPRTSRALLRRAVQATLQHAGRQDLAVSLLLTDDAGIAAIHAQWFDDPTPTDVISFAVDDCAELVVSTETAVRCARAHGTAVADEVALYVVHGILHVCGFDDRQARARQRMRKAERAVLQQLQLNVAAVDD